MSASGRAVNGNGITATTMSLKVNGETIPQEDIDLEVERLKPDYDRFVRDQNADGGDEQLLKWSKENLVERVLIRQEAGELPDPPRDPEQDEGPGPEYVLQQKVDQLIESVSDKVVPPSDKELRNHYKQHRGEFRTSEQLRASHIVKHTDHGEDRTQAYAEILNVKSQLDKGVAFEELAYKHSDCPGDAGDLGSFGRGQMVQEFEDVVFAMEVDQVSDIFETPFGFHIAKVYDKRPGGTVPFEEVKDHIAEQLAQERRTQTLEKYVDVLRAKAVIEDT